MTGYYPERTVHDSPPEYPPELWLARGGILHHEKIDFGFMGLVDGQTANVSSAMEIILVDDVT